MTVVQWSVTKPEEHEPVTVHFIGAGPGAPDLLTLRAQRLIAAAPVCLYAGALVPPEVLAHAPQDARLVDTQHLQLDEIVAELQAAHAEGHDVARLHSGDLSIYSALAEQTRRLDELGIPWDVTPGVPAFAAAAAALRRELTVPEVAQTVILTRYGRLASEIPPGEQLAGLAAHGATLVVHLGTQAIEEIAATLAPHYGADCPAVVVARASWPDELVLRRHRRHDRRPRCTRPVSGGPRRSSSAPRSRAEGFRDSHLYSKTRDRPPDPWRDCSAHRDRRRRPGPRHRPGGQAR